MIWYLGVSVIYFIISMLVSKGKGYNTIVSIVVSLVFALVWPLSLIVESVYILTKR
jgi:hypothetical protein